METLARKVRVWIGNDSATRKRILGAAHDAGFRRTYYGSSSVPLYVEIRNGPPGLHFNADTKSWLGSVHTTESHFRRCGVQSPLLTEPEFLEWIKNAL